METEFEATFVEVDKNLIRDKLKSLGATKTYSEFLQTRATFELPSGHEIKGAWARVRNEFDKTTMSIKIVDGDKIDAQKEICLTIDSFDSAVSFLKTSGFTQKAFQETKRELWVFDGVEVTIDTWPFLEPFVEIEGKTESDVKNIAVALDFDYEIAIFDSITALYAKKYNISRHRINQDTPKIVFDMKNPFL
jgi:adenylate cyclase class 2